MSVFLTILGSKEIINELTQELGHPVTETVINAPSGMRGLWIHPDLAASFASTMNRKYALFVGRVMRRYEAGDLSLAASVVQNYDTANNTTSTVLVQSIDNNILEKRQRTIDCTKDTNEEIRKRRVLDGSAYPIKNGMINKAVFGFPTTTTQFRKANHLKPYETPRNYAQQEQLDAIVFSETIFKGIVANAPEEITNPELLQQLRVRADEIAGLAAAAGLHALPLRKERIKQALHIAAN